MTNRQNTLLLKRSNIIGKTPPLSGLTLGELALNTADAKLYTSFTSGTTGATEVRQIGWDRLSTESGGTVNGDVIVNGNLSASTITITTQPETDIQTTTQYLTRDSSTGLIKTKTIPGPTVYGLFSQTGNSFTVSATTVESTLIDGGVGTLIVPANGFAVGDSFRADFGGLISSKNGDTIRIRIKTGSIVLGDSGNQTLNATTDDVWQLTVNFTIRQIGVAGIASVVSLGVFHTTKQSNASPEGFAFNTVNNTTFDTTISNTLDVTVEFSSDSPLNKIYSDIFVLNKIY